MLNLPPHLDPADVLGFIEGEPLPIAPRRAVLAAMDVDPSLRRAIEAMQADRVGLAGMAHVSAPARVMEQVEEALGSLETAAERETLLGLAAGEQRAPGGIATSQVQYERPGVIATIAASRWLRPLAAAAAVALVAGAAFYGLRAAMSGGGRSIAKSTGGTSEVDPAPIPAPEVAAQVPAAERSPAADVVDPVGTPAPVDVASTEPAREPAPKFGMTLDRALALAAEGRLLIRARAMEAGVVVRRVNSMIERPTVDRAAARVVGEPVARVLASARDCEVPGIPAGVPTAAPTVAADGAGPESPSAPELPAATVTTWRESGDVFSLHLRPTQRALREVLESLTRGGTVGVTLLEAPAPLADDLGPDPGAILWWSSTRTWDRRGTAGIVVQVP